VHVEEHPISRRPSLDHGDLDHDDDDGGGRNHASLNFRCGLKAIRYGVRHKECGSIRKVL
jgi:hypothetical protein